MSRHATAPDDVVATFEEASENERVPLLVLEPLAAFLDEHSLGDGVVEATPVGDGRSNVTYVVRSGAGEMVLRRPPRPPLPPSAHDVLREARIMAALEGRAAVPRVLAVCSDAAVIGAPFYVMEKVEGAVLHDSVPPALDSPEFRRSVGAELIDALVDLHAVDWRACGLEGFGRPDGYLERQVRRFGGLWQHNKTREVPLVDRLARWLADNLPESGPATIVHGDFRPGNMIYAEETPTRLLAILDWEMATIGDPLADLGYLALCWVDRDDPPGAVEHFALTRGDGFYRRRELIERYAQRSGKTIADLRWYQVLAAWKSVIFMEGNYARAAAGLSDDPFLMGFGDGVLQLAEHAADLAFGKGVDRA
jgi:aminoglycoside phosphotransferase (APT) family kinase protein